MGIINCIIYLAIIGIVSFFVGLALPNKFFAPKSFPYRMYSFENNGKIYEKIKIRLWKDKLIDMSKIFTKIMHPKSIDESAFKTTNINEKLNQLIIETCRAELIHTLLVLFGFFCIIICKGIGGIIISLLYAIGNMPYIIVQRYNRPRFFSTLEHCSERRSR